MDGFSSAHRAYVSSGQNRGVDSKAHAVSNVFVVRSNPPLSTSSGMYPGNKVVSSYKSTSWFNSREWKRKKRVAKYKLYAVEGKVKSSWKNGFRWFKHTCRKIVNGF